MQRQDLIRHIVTHLPQGSLTGLNARGQQVIQLCDKRTKTQTYATLEMLSEERLSEIAEMEWLESA